MTIIVVLNSQQNLDNSDEWGDDRTLILADETGPKASIDQLLNL
jgi:hypothetical protein